MYIDYQKLLHVSAPRRNHQLVSNTKEYRHQYIDLGTTMARVKTFKY